MDIYASNDEKVEIIALHRLFFEVSKVTHFSKIPLLRWNNPSGPILNSITRFYTLTSIITTYEIKSIQ